jgi:hypothetical protein
MHFCAIHVDDLGAPDRGEEEVYVFVPGAAKPALAVPLDALAPFLALLEKAVGADTWPQCPACGAPIPRLSTAVHPGAQCARRHPEEPGFFRGRSPDGLSISRSDEVTNPEIPGAPAAALPGSSRAA